MTERSENAGGNVAGAAESRLQPLRISFRADSPLDRLMRATHPRRRAMIIRSLAEECLKLKQAGLHHFAAFTPDAPSTVERGGKVITVRIDVNHDLPLDEMIRSTPRDLRCDVLRGLAEEYLAIRQTGLRPDVGMAVGPPMTQVRATPADIYSGVGVSTRLQPVIEAPVGSVIGRQIVLDAPTGNAFSLSSNGGDSPVGI